VDDIKPRKQLHKIDDLEGRLYGRDFETVLPDAEQHFSGQKNPHSNTQTNSQKSWKSYDDLQPSSEQVPFTPRVVTHSFFKKTLLFSFVFFLVCAGIFAFMMYRGLNVVSSDNVVITFLGPVQIAAGDELDTDIVVTNQNSSPIENATINIEYPDGTKSTQDATADQLHSSISVGEIAAHAYVQKTAKAIIFGELNAIQHIKVSVTYTLTNSSAVYNKDKVYDVAIISTPISLTLDSQSQVSTGDQTSIVATIVSNSHVPLSNLIVRADYPFGYTFNGSDPAPVQSTNNVWSLSSLKPGEKKQITIRGVLQGEQNDQRAVRLNVGVRDEANPNAIAVRYTTQSTLFTLQKPPLAVAITLNGSSDATQQVDQGQTVSGSIAVTNNSSDTIHAISLSGVISGEIFDSQSFRADQGVYRSDIKSVTWDSTKDADLQSLAPGQQAQVNFTLATTRNATKNSSVTIKVAAQGSLIASGQQARSLSGSAQSVLTVGTQAAVIPQTLYGIGPFKNRGSIPPKINKKTTYTILLSVTDSINDIAGAEVHATLPTFVTWLGVTSPNSESVSWNSDKNEVVWHVGNVPAQTGITKSSRQVYIQVELNPTIEQLGAEPQLMQQIYLTATDSFTGKPITSGTKYVTTRLSSESKYNQDDATPIVSQ
jgi:hypothetical protein